MNSIAQSPLVSICVPIYNVEKYIDRCARSLLEQTYEKTEIIFVDDCSPDNSVLLLEHIIAEYSSRDTVKIIRHEHNRGLAASRNTAVDAASGDFIMHVDSDDWLEINAVEKLVSCQMETGADIVSGNAIVHHTDGKTEMLIEPSYCSKYEMMETIVGLNIHHVIWCRLIRRSLYTENQIKAMEGVNLGEDHHTFPRLVYFSNSLAQIDDVVYNYNRMVNNSLLADSLSGFKLKNYCDTIESFKILSDFFSSHNESILSKIINQNRLSYAYRVAHEYSNLDNRSFQVINSDIHRFKKEAYGHYLKLVFFDFLNKLHVLDYLVKTKKRLRMCLSQFRK